MGYKVPFVAYGLQYEKLKKEIDETMQDVLSRGDLIVRQDVENFEKSLAEFVDAKYAVSLNSGTDALFFSLLIAGIGKGDEVITVSHTFVASIATIVQAGATPVLVDVKEDYLMDEKQLEKAITERTKAIIPVYLNGRMCNMEKIKEIAQKHNLLIIEDSAQALGASFNNQKAGAIGYTGCFSFYPAKILGCFGDGGALTTNNPEVAEKARLLRDHGQKTKTEILIYGWNSRLDNIQAAVLNVKLRYLPQWIERRREIAKMYSENLKGVDLPERDGDRIDVFQNYVIKAKKRDELYNFLKEKGIETLIKDPVPTHWQKNLNLDFSLPVSERLAKEVISLPMYPELTNEQVDYVIKCVNEFYGV